MGMHQLSAGQFFGETAGNLNLNGVILTETEYTHPFVDWHYHENRYFTFILQGRVIEGNKKETYHCDAGTLLFHNWQEPHFNQLPPGKTRGLHLEVTSSFLQQFSINDRLPEGTINIKNPKLKLLFYQLFLAFQQNDAISNIAITSLTANCLSQLSDSKPGIKQSPPWVNQIKELLYFGDTQHLTLSSLALTLQIHPAHLSRDFQKYFGCNLGDYLRALKLSKAMHLLADTHLNLSEVAAASGFSDQSHFIRLFKSEFKKRPAQAKKILTKINTAR